MENLKAILNKYRPYNNREFIDAVLVGFLFLILSLLANYIAGTYATERASNAVTDIILSNIPVFDVDTIFIYGPILLWIGIAGLLLSEPKWLPFSLKSIAVFILIRSFFISLTHIGPFPSQITIGSNFFLDKTAFGGDLFFSGHTGIPFLMALLFWNYPKLRITFLIASLVFGVSVILGHLHYSIDVFSAFFITYGIYHICQIIFPKDFTLFRHGTFQVQ